MAWAIRFLQPMLQPIRIIRKAIESLKNRSLHYFFLRKHEAEKAEVLRAFFMPVVGMML